jgi:TonB family protein
MAICMILLVVPVVALAQLPSSAPAQIAAPPPPPPPPPPAQASGKWWKNSATVRAVDLSEAQVARLEAIFLQHQPRLAGLRSSLLSEEERLRVLLEADRLDDQAISAQRKSVTRSRSELLEESSEMTLEMRRVMTAEQWRKLEKMKQDLAAPPAPPALPTPPALPAPPAPPSPPSRPTLDSGRKIYNVGTPGLKEPEMVSTPRPPYTDEAKTAKIEGIVLLQAVVRADGTVDSFKLIRGLGHGLDESAIRTISKQWRFRPGILNGLPVDVRVQIEISFRLGA